MHFLYNQGFQTNYTVSARVAFGTESSIFLISRINPFSPEIGRKTPGPCILKTLSIWSIPFLVFRTSIINLCSTINSYFE